jgi:hypothetical protein
MNRKTLAKASLLDLTDVSTDLDVNQAVGTGSEQ